AAMPAPPPPLFVPPAVPEPVPVIQLPAPPPPPAPIPTAPRIVYVPQPVPTPMPVPVPVQAPPQRAATGPVLVFEGASAGAPIAATAGAAQGEGDGASPAASPGGTATLGGRTRAGVLANRGTTVAQGTLIPAVLETALDSTRAGFARAIVSRDVRGLDRKSVV